MASVEVGDEVWVKPPGARCFTHWNRGQITDVTSSNNVSVDGVPRHILDVRKIVIPCEDDGVVTEVEDSGSETERRYPLRQRRPPVWADDYDISNDNLT